MEGKLNFNFFDWIRAGVRHAVLLGVSDAVEDLGTPNEGDQSSRRLLEILRGENSEAATEPRLSDASAPKRRKLGRSLRDAVGATEPAPAGEAMS